MVTLTCIFNPAVEGKLRFNPVDGCWPEPLRVGAGLSPTEPSAATADMPAAASLPLTSPGAYDTLYMGYTLCRLYTTYIFDELSPSPCLPGRCGPPETVSNMIGISDVLFSLSTRSVGLHGHMYALKGANGEMIIDDFET